MDKIAKRLLFVISAIILIIVVSACVYILYVVLQYYRIEDNQIVETENNMIEQLIDGKEYSIVTYNIGFGAYDQEYSFFMDTGEMLDGTKVTGKYGKAVSKQRVLDSTNGSIAELEKLNADIMLIQEVDLISSRARGVNQGQLLKVNFPSYSYTYTSDFHTAYLLYPFSDPHGKTEAGLATLSKYNIESTIRRSYPVPTGFDKFFDLDRCFSLHRLPVDNGKELVVINSHMSAYDKGGVIRSQQLELLNSTISAEYEKGNYVIVGGDFNHTLGEDLVNAFPSKQKNPEWIAVLSDGDLPEGFSIAKAENRFEVPTCRAAEIPWERGVNFTTVVDGFIVSDNIEWETMNIDVDFKYSDHQPVVMKFSLK